MSKSPGAEIKTFLRMQVTEEQINDVLNQCVDQIDEGASKWPGMSYEQGVDAALRWVMGDGENPLND